MEKSRRWVTRKGEEHMAEGIEVGGWWGRRGIERGLGGEGRAAAREPERRRRTR
jgi:hypothetical protein